ncbi:MAG: class I SAM-dependent methyltransferase [Lachnospiraceae bacterium]|nr:class I SAM-dependent methyltransferase [Lachnospiraceae bacterium]
MTNRVKRVGKEKKKIDKVILDLSSYSGRDLYSEGAAEDELLRIVRTKDAKEYNRVIAERGSWNLLYHLSHIRENIVDFLPITKNDSVLEVGAGCGAISGALARKAGHVTSIELSKRRSIINAVRNNYDNLEIKVGNFQDIEKRLQDKYDYILLIGVLEYSGLYIDDEYPFDRMLEILRERLAEEGRIIAAIENKYGMKYFAGAKEDHTGGYYDGIEGYRDTGRVRTFSKKELMELAQRNGLSVRFMYPYPDYKLPISIYSDERLPFKGELTEYGFNFDSERLRLFSENDALDSAADSGMFGEFSNSFLVEMGAGSDAVNGALVKSGVKVLYSKHSNERDLKFAIRTDIVEGLLGDRRVMKYPYSDEAVQHLKVMQAHYLSQRTLYADTDLEPNTCRIINDEAGNFKGLEFEYLEGKNLAEAFDGLIEVRNLEGAGIMLRKYIDTLKYLADEEYVETQEFRRVFGAVKLPAGELCMSVTNIDLIFSNIIINNSWNVIDYEWTFDFPIPVKYVLYRAIHYYLKTAGENAFGELDPYQMAEITKEERAIFNRMEQTFQRYISGDRFTLVTLNSIFGKNNIPRERAVRLGGLVKRPERVKLYLDFGGGFDEDNTRYINADLENGDIVSFEVIIPKNCVALRIDPTDYPCMIKVLSFTVNGKDAAVLTNGSVFDDGVVYFDTSDPQFLVSNTWAGNRVSMVYEIGVLEEKFAGAINSLVKEKRDREKSLKARIRREEELKYSRVKL